MSFRNDFNDSKADFINIVWPAIVKSESFKDGELLHVETYNDPLMLKFDRSTAIDAYVANCELSSGGMVGLAVRNQWECHYHTLTIRFSRSNGCKTEFHKVNEAIVNNTVFPQFYCHSYLSERHGRLLESFIVPTLEMYRIINEDFEFQKKNEYFRVIYIKTNKSDGNTFIVVPFHLLQDALHGVYPIEEEKNYPKITV